MPRWIIEPEWLGEDVFIIGGGESLRDFDWSLLRDELTIGCNTAFTLGSQICKLCIFGDFPWFKKFKKELERYKGILFTNVPQLQKSNFPWLWLVERRSTGLHKDALGWNSNTGASAINLALLLGAKRVFLLGFDMKIKDRKHNWHDERLRKHQHDVYPKFIKAFRKVSLDLSAKFPDREVINITSDSDLPYFPKIDPVKFWKGRSERQVA